MPQFPLHLRGKSPGRRGRGSGTLFGGATRSHRLVRCCRRSFTSGSPPYKTPDEANPWLDVPISRSREHTPPWATPVCGVSLASLPVAEKPAFYIWHDGVLRIRGRGNPCQDKCYIPTNNVLTVLCMPASQPRDLLLGDWKQQARPAKLQVSSTQNKTTNVPLGR